MTHGEGKQGVPVLPSTSFRSPLSRIASRVQAECLPSPWRQLAIGHCRALRALTVARMSLRPRAMTMLPGGPPLDLPV